MKQTKECPACGLMCAEDADTCKHCGTAFFFQPECLEPRFDASVDNLMVVAVYPSLAEAHIILSLLQENDIEAYIEITPSGLWENPIERATIRVPRDVFESTQRIIAEQESS